MKNAQALSIIFLTLLATAPSSQSNASCCVMEYAAEEADAVEIGAEATISAAKLGVNIIEDAAYLAEQAVRSKKQEVADRRAKALAEQHRLADEATKRKLKIKRDAELETEQEATEIEK